MRDPFKKLMSNVKLSAKHGSRGARGQKALNPEYKERKIDFDSIYLKQLFEQQEYKCHWLDIPLDPKWIFKSWHPLAISVDRMDCEKGYTKDNIVICCRLVNLGRCRYDEVEFTGVMDYIKANL
tara:strand:- start:176 stop:547 length:372 start_codon:yes stop_codon:yes gene_type:complete